MGRVAAVFGAISSVLALLAQPAYADCATDIHSLRSEAAAIKDERRRQELLHLVEKAEKDDKAGRASACDKTVQQARVLLK